MRRTIIRFDDPSASCDFADELAELSKLVLVLRSTYNATTVTFNTRKSLRI